MLFCVSFNWASANCARTNCSSVLRVSISSRDVMSFWSCWEVFSFGSGSSKGLSASWKPLYSRVICYRWKVTLSKYNNHKQKILTWNKLKLLKQKTNYCISIRIWIQESFKIKTKTSKSILTTLKYWNTEILKFKSFYHFQITLSKE